MTLLQTATAECPLWSRFSHEPTDGDVELIRLQQLAGYCLTGVTREHALVFVYSPTVCPAS
jgi:putative DNA primase/helicase